MEFAASSPEKANFRKVCTEKQSGTGTSARVHATYIRVCRRAGALPSPVLFLVRSAVGLVHTFNACSDSQACFAGAISPAAKPSCSCAHLLAVPQCVVANLFTLNVCIYLVRLRVQRAEGIQHLCAAFGHGPRPSRQRLHTEGSAPLWAASSHRASKASSICAPCLAMAQGVVAEFCTSMFCVFSLQWRRVKAYGCCVRIAKRMPSVRIVFFLLPFHRAAAAQRKNVLLNVGLTSHQEN